jgi:K+:H+ antiporter
MTAPQVGMLMLALAVVIVLARVLGAVARRVGQPPVVGEIVAGIVVGPTFFGTTISHEIFPKEITPGLSGLANVGLVLFMFIVGYDLDYTLVRGRVRVAASVSVGSIILPLGLGITLAYWLAGNHGVVKVTPFALFIGAAMSITAFPVLARILTDRGMHRIPVGGMALAAAAVDDVIAWSLLAVVVTIAGAGAESWHVLFAVPFMLVMFLVVRPQLRRIVDAHRKAGRLLPGTFAIVLVGLLLSCYITEWLGVHVIFGAFLFGVIMPRIDGAALRHEILERLEQVSVLLLLPVYFVLAGMKVDLSKVGSRGLTELGLILLVAIGGKFIGAYLGARLHGVRNRQASALAALMNTRGLTEIVILTVGLQLKILDTSLYSLMVVMALITTVMTGPLLALVYPPRRVAQDVAAAEKAALGITDAYRVMVVIDSPDDSDRIIAMGADLIGPHRPAELVLSHVVPYQSRLEIGSGLSGELLEMTRIMDELEQRAADVRDRGFTVRVLARLSADPRAELAAQVAATEPDVVVVPADHAGLDELMRAGDRLLVVLRADDVDRRGVSVLLDQSTPQAAADDTVRVAALLAAARGGELVVDAGGRANRHLSGVLDDLRGLGLPIRVGTAASDASLVVAPQGGRVGDAQVIVRAGAEPESAEPRQWLPPLARTGESLDPSINA